MRFTPRVSPFRSLHYVSLFIISFFLIFNSTDFSLSRVFAPSFVQAKTPEQITEKYIPSDIPTSGDADLDQIIFDAGERYGVDPRLIHAVIWKESKYNPRAESHKGAQGLMQMIPATARRFNCADISDPLQNVEAGTKYLRWLLQRFNGNVALTLAAYNAGEGAVDKYAGVPPFGETQDYVRSIIARYGKTFHPLLDPAEARIEFHLDDEMAQLQSGT